MLKRLGQLFGLFFLLGFTYLNIDVTHVPAGIHRLTVTVRDRKTGQTAERNVLFRVVE